MTDESHAMDEAGEWVTASIKLNVSGAQLEMDITVPVGETRPRRMLPIFQSLAEALVGVGVREAEAEGRAVSCKKGCGACCRQLVPLAEMEAHQLVELIESLPEPRRTTVRARFDDAYERLRAAGLLEKLEYPERFQLGEMMEFGMEYFRQGIACPFLEEESCSIHPSRPIACREYLVTSSPEHCATPTIETVEGVEVPNKVSIALCRLTQDPAKTFIPWVPLILAPRWVAAHPEEMPPRKGTELLQEVFKRLTDKKKESE
ncbi:MAG TPA: YkgJ family cysteine cluster protein [Pyrinomonadaceae bacterium]|jgi:Fe-S-cluster containining protein